MAGPSIGGVTPASPFDVDLIPDGQTDLNITSATVLKAVPGRLVRINVVVAGSAAGAAYDAATLAGDIAANQVAVIPNVVGPIALDWPCLTGIVVVPGTGQTLSVTWY